MKYRGPHLIPVVVSLLLLAACFAVLMFTSLSGSKESYEEFVTRIRHFETDQKGQRSQQRTGVKKEVWFNQNGSRMQLMLEANQAEIRVAQTAVEYFTQVTASLFEEGIDAVHLLKKGRADQAEYHYSTQELYAQKFMAEEFTSPLFSFLSADDLFYRQKMVELTGNVTLEGPSGQLVADYAEMSLVNYSGAAQGRVKIKLANGVQLFCGWAEFDLPNQCAQFHEEVEVIHPDGTIVKADHIALEIAAISEQAQVSEIAALNAAGNVLLFREDLWSLRADAARYVKATNSIEFTMHDAASSVQLTDTRGKVYARRAAFDIDSQECLLSGDVKMIHREGALEQYALADRVRILKGEKEIRFYANRGKKVLFYDKINRLQMSAPEISVIGDPASKKNTVKGLGKVRFHFKDEEYEQLRQYFLIEKEHG